MKIICASAFALLLSISTSSAADIKYVGETKGGFDSRSLYRLDGNIVGGDAETFVEVFKSSNVPNYSMHQFQVELNSPGGSYIEGLKLAAQFKNLGISTIVRSDDSCYSACALAFLGGSDRSKDPSGQSEHTGQLPNRSLEKNAVLGFHAPYLNLKNADNDLPNVEDAYRLAIDSISMLIQMSDELNIEATELPKLLKPGRDSFFYADTVDAIRTLSIDYTDMSPYMKDLPGVTRSMILNACINRWYHSKRRSAYEGYLTAELTRKDFEEGSELLENGETGYSFGVNRTRDYNKPTWIAFTPIKLSDDGKKYIWCLYNGSVYYRTAGSVKELFEILDKNNNVSDLLNDGETINIERSYHFNYGSMRASDMVPANTAISDVSKVIDELIARETIIK